MGIYCLVLLSSDQLLLFCWEHLIMTLSASVDDPKSATGINPRDDPFVFTHHPAGPALQASSIVKTDVSVLIKLIKYRRTYIKTGLVTATGTDGFIYYDMGLFFIYIELVLA